MSQDLGPRDDGAHPGASGRSEDRITHRGALHPLPDGRPDAKKDPAFICRGTSSITRALAIPVKRFDRGVVSYLSREEMTALLNAPTPSTWSGHRDGVMLATLYNTGARVSEITKLNVED